MNEDVVLSKLQSFYEIINDFSRLRILKFMLDKEVTIEEISVATKTSIVVLTHQIDYLLDNKILSSNTISDETKYMISNQYVIKRLKSDIKYVSKRK